MLRPAAIALAVLVAFLGPRPVHASSGRTLIVPRPCPDPSQILPYGRTRGQSVPDGRGGVFVSWADDRQVSIQRFAPSGLIAPGWPALGLPIGWIPASEEGYQFSLTADGAGGALLTWIGRSGEVRLQRVAADCGIARAWPDGGLVLCRLEGTGRHPVAALTDNASIMVVWREQEVSGTQSVRLSRATLSGSQARGLPADGLPLATGFDLANVCEMVPDGHGGAFVSWVRSGEREYRREIVVQRITADGAVARRWPAQGLIVTESLAPGMRGDDSMEHPLLETDGGGGVFVVWGTGRLAAPELYDTDLMAQRLTGGGAVAPGWPEGGKVVAGGGGDQHLAASAPDRGGLLVAWFDEGTEGRIRVARLEATGALATWGAGVRATSVERIAATPGDRGSVFVAWTARNEPAGRPRLTRWDSRGTIQEMDSSTPVGSPKWDPTRLGLVSDGRGGALMIWQDWVGGDGYPNRYILRVSAGRPPGTPRPGGR